MEVIIGVLIGAVIGYVAAITTLLVEHRRWKKEFKLQYLITERKRREEQCDRIKELLVEALAKDAYSVEFAEKAFMRLPKKEGGLILKALTDIDHSNDKGKQKLYREASLILGTYLGKIDEQIEELTK